MGLKGPALLLFTAGLAAGQTLAPTGDLKFEVASFKPTSHSAADSYSLQPTSGGTRYVGTNLALNTYVFAAFQVRLDLTAGNPDWLGTERYDLNAVAERPSTLDQLHIMLQNLLIDRMKLRYHLRQKEMPAPVLSVAKKGPKNLTPHPLATGTDFLLDEEYLQASRVEWTAHCSSMDLLAFRISRLLRETVVNETGLSGCFDFGLKFVTGPSPEPGKGVNGIPTDFSGPQIFDALEAQLGLKLEQKKARVEIMVIDHAERPTED
jgi:uncharacterized protein (TIGR03435 family)